MVTKPIEAKDVNPTMREHSVNGLNNFIGGWYHDNTDFCDKLIKFHQESDNVVQGRYGNNLLDLSFKDSLDCYIDPASSGIFVEYVDWLTEITKEYVKKYPKCNDYSAWAIAEGFTIKKYNKGSAFHAWHSERITAQMPKAARHLVFLTYLNDIQDAGETEFFHQGIKIKPEKGLTIIWPADWTFTHRGLPSPSEEKYIINGWYHFIK